MRACATISGLAVTDAPWPINEGALTNRRGKATMWPPHTHAHTRTIGSSAHDIWAKTIIVRTDIQMTAHFNGPIGPWPVNLSTLANPVVMGPVVFSGSRTFRSLKHGGGGGRWNSTETQSTQDVWLEYCKTSRNNRWCYKNWRFLCLWSLRSNKDLFYVNLHVYKITLAYEIKNTHIGAVICA